MMADRIEIDFTANVREVTKGTDEIADSLEDTERALDDVGEAGEDAGKKTTGALDDVSSSAKDAGDAVANDAGGGFEELATKADGALGEVGDGLLGLAGIAGGAAGAAGAAISGAFDLIKTEIDKQTEAAQELRDNLVGAYQAASAEGFTYLSNALIIAAANDIAFDTSKREAAAAKAAEIGVTLETYILAQAGSIDALNTSLEAAEQAYDNVGVAAGTGSKSAQAEAVEQGLAIQGVISELDRLKDAHVEGQEAASTEAAIRQQLSDSELAAIQRTNDASQARFEALAAAHQKASELPDIVIGSEITVPDVDAIANEMQRRARGYLIKFPGAVVDSTGRVIS